MLIGEQPSIVTTGVKRKPEKEDQHRSKEKARKTENQASSKRGKALSNEFIEISDNEGASDQLSMPSSLASGAASVPTPSTAAGGSNSSTVQVPASPATLNSPAALPPVHQHLPAIAATSPPLLTPSAEGQPPQNQGFDDGPSEFPPSRPPLPVAEEASSSSLPTSPLPSNDGSVSSEVAADSSSTSQPPTDTGRPSRRPRVCFASLCVVLY